MSLEPYCTAEPLCSCWFPSVSWVSVISYFFFLLCLVIGHTRNLLPAGSSFSVWDFFPIDDCLSRLTNSICPTFLSGCAPIAFDFPKSIHKAVVCCYLPIAGARLMSVRAYPHAGGPTHCISGALAAPRSSTI